MRDEKKVIQEIRDFISSNNKHCLVVGTDMQHKHLEILKYLNSLNKKLRVLFRSNSMQNLESLFGGYKKRKTGTPYKIGNLTLYFDSMQNKSQQNTPRESNCIIIYPIDSLKGAEDKNIQDILNFRDSEKVFWISWSDNANYNYLKEICDIKHDIVIDTKDEIIHKRILENTVILKNEELVKIQTENLSYCEIEKAISKKYNLGYIHSSSLGQEMLVDAYGEYTLCGSIKTGTFMIKAKKSDEHGYAILVKKIK